MAAWALDALCILLLQCSLPRRLGPLCAALRDVLGCVLAILRAWPPLLRRLRAVLPWAASVRAPSLPRITVRASAASHIGLVRRPRDSLDSHQEEEHEAHVKQVLNQLRQYKLYCNLKKCEFGTNQVDFLGFARILFETDASGFAIAAVISQQVADSKDPSKSHWHPVAFFSRKMTDAES
ncbi:hypothetical protein VE03_10369 [Pseudogymnoascus sp. 23342-1-I1]|nr:hypothetical protein VE03_10369 [Pseudogymnoascus sp. 23342-1-I1]